MMLTEVMVSGMLEEKQSLRKLLASYGLHAGVVQGDNEKGTDGIADGIIGIRGAGVG